MSELKIVFWSIIPAAAIQEMMQHSKKSSTVPEIRSETGGGSEHFLEHVNNLLAVIRILILSGIMLCLDLYQCL